MYVLWYLHIFRESHPNKWDSRWYQTCDLQGILWSCSTWQKRSILSLTPLTNSEVIHIDLLGCDQGGCEWMKKRTNCIEVKANLHWNSTNSTLNGCHFWHICATSLRGVFWKNTYCISLLEDGYSVTVVLCSYASRAVPLMWLYSLLSSHLHGCDITWTKCQSILSPGLNLNLYVYSALAQWNKRPPLVAKHVRKSTSVWIFMDQSIWSV